PEHALYVDGMLVPAWLLANGTTIAQEFKVERIEYFHIVLAEQVILFAEGTAVESYVDCSNRLMFHNAAEFTALYPDSPSHPARFRAPRLEPGASELAPLRAA